MVNNWNDQLIYLSKIAEMEPLAAYAAFIRDFKSKFIYFLRTACNSHEYFQHTDETITNKFIPASPGGQTVNDSLREKRPNTEFILVSIFLIYEVNLRIKSEYGPGKTPYLGTFHTVIFKVNSYHYQRDMGVTNNNVM